MKFTSIAFTSLLCLVGHSPNEVHAFISPNQLQAPRASNSQFIRNNDDLKNAIFSKRTSLYYRNETIVTTDVEMSEETSLRKIAKFTDLGLDFSPVSLFGKGRTSAKGDKKLLGGKGANLAEMVSSISDD